MTVIEHPQTPIATSTRMEPGGETRLTTCRVLGRPGVPLVRVRLREVLGWEPQICLRDGLVPTYRWIESDLRKAGRLPPEDACG